ncbi:MAG: hypothetical protein ACD_58C00147G0008 [uncultured bacterium]|nr:MAG: hypothetical protein ACD_58C00147G0008 [uncultured bacterium]
MKQIYLYIGSGANQSNEVENTLQAFDIQYSRICEHQFANVASDGILIIPGGDPLEILKNWQKSDLKKIQQFATNGGTYIGICAGVYVADKIHLGYDGLGFVSEIKDRATHSQTVNVKNNQGKVMEMVIENNPDLGEIKNSETVLLDEEGNLAAIRTFYGKGQVYLFAHHIEGSVYYKKLPRDYASAEYFANFLKSLIVD